MAEKAVTGGTGPPSPENCPESGKNAGESYFRGLSAESDTGAQNAEQSRRRSRRRTPSPFCRPAAASDLGPELRRIWHIADDEPPHRVAAIVFLRLEAVLDRLNRQKLEKIVRTAYNTDTEPLAGNKGDRLKSLAGGPSLRTCDRWLEPFQKLLAASLGGPQDRLAPERGPAG
ncbi:hypothetical protein [Amycolatopsis sp. NPDC004169]|uniref:hypothetical protein n=1 Tax=Amycolatopsis sp. NPDC004169 TaxID=3154453 RepID=UPI00339F8AA1